MSRTECLSDAMECNATPYSTIIVLVRGSTIIVPGPDSTIFVPIQGSTIIVPWKVSTIFVLYVFSTDFVLLSVSVLFCSSSLIYKEKLLLQSLCSEFGYTISGPSFVEFSWIFGCSQWEQSSFSYSRTPIHRFLSNAPLGSKQDHPASFVRLGIPFPVKFLGFSGVPQWNSRSFPIAGRHSIGFSLMVPLGPVKSIPWSFHLHRPFPALTLGFMQ